MASFHIHRKLQCNVRCQRLSYIHNHYFIIVGGWRIQSSEVGAFCFDELSEYHVKDRRSAESVGLSALWLGIGDLF